MWRMMRSLKNNQPAKRLASPDVPSLRIDARWAVEVAESPLLVREHQPLRLQLGNVLRPILPILPRQEAWRLAVSER
jgi:hypothetical protein